MRHGSPSARPAPRRCPRRGSSSPHRSPGTHASTRPAPPACVRAAVSGPVLHEVHAPHIVLHRGLATFATASSRILATSLSRHGFGGTGRRCVLRCWAATGHTRRSDTSITTFTRSITRRRRPSPNPAIKTPPCHLFQDQDVEILLGNQAVQPAVLLDRGALNRSTRYESDPVILLQLLHAAHRIPVQCPLLGPPAVQGHPRHPLATLPHRRSACPLPGPRQSA